MDPLPAAAPSEPDNAIAHREAGRHAEAAQALQHWLASHPDDAPCHAHLAQALLAMGQEAAAAQAIGRALALAPGLPVVQRNLARLLLTQRAAPAALQAAQAAFQGDPADPENQLVLASALGANQQDGPALELIGRALQARPGYAEAYAGRAALKLRAGDAAGALADADQALALKPFLPRLWQMVGSVRQQLRDFRGAMAAFEQAVTQEPGNVALRASHGQAALQAGQPALAATALQAACALAPDNAGLWLLFGTALQESRREREAMAVYAHALPLAASQPDVQLRLHFNLGVLCNAQGQWEQALVHLDQVLLHQAAHTGALDSKMVALISLERHQPAELAARQLLALLPDHIGALNCRAACLLALGDPVAALASAMRSLQLQPGHQAKRLFVNCVRAVAPDRIDAAAQLHLVAALGEPWCRPSDLTPCVLGVLRRQPALAALLARAAAAWPARLAPDQFLGPQAAAALADPLLCALLNASPVNDNALEQLLGMARHALLATVADASADALLPFWCALARQCFINEYLFDVDAADIAAAGRLRDALGAALQAGQPVAPAAVLAVACYFPLYSMAAAERLLQAAWPPALAAVLAQQLTEPEQERRLRGEVERITPIADRVSQLVAEQYEQNPYPRWVNMDRNGSPLPLLPALQRFFPQVQLAPFQGQADTPILVAGCGTGQHPISTAEQFQGATVLAVDLSKASLAYARRKTIDMGLDHRIRYAQADLLELGTLGRQFDVVESIGVLHHLSDPMAGWRSLLPLVRPRGFMQLGFYSALARRHITAAQQLLAAHGFASDADGIRAGRRHLLALGPDSAFGGITGSLDFYSLSACRDLLFHVQEHCMSLDALDGFMRDNGLTFLGFSLKPATLRAYHARFPNDPAATNLAQWHTFEQEHPDTFAAMYQFWVQKQD